MPQGGVDQRAAKERIPSSQGEVVDEIDSESNRNADRLVGDWLEDLVLLARQRIAVDESAHEANQNAASESGDTYPNP